jgi:hypothetical protein
MVGGAGKLQYTVPMDPDGSVKARNEMHLYFMFPTVKLRGKGHITSEKVSVIVASIIIIILLLLLL